MIGVLLTLAAGGLDATAFLALGSVFASVMTGNLVVLGVAAGSRDADLALAAGLALAGYVAGTLSTAVVTRWTRRARHRPYGVPAPLCWEAVLLLAFSATWEVAAGDPHGAVRSVLLVLAALAMGAQSTAVRALAPGGVSTTYLTGTLTGVLTGVVGAGESDRAGRAWATARLAGLVLGAGITAWVLSAAPAWQPALPLLALALAIGLEAGRPPRREGAP